MGVFYVFQWGSKAEQRAALCFKELPIDEICCWMFISVSVKSWDLFTRPDTVCQSWCPDLSGVFS